MHVEEIELEYFNRRLFNTVKEKHIRTFDVVKNGTEKGKICFKVPGNLEADEWEEYDPGTFDTFVPEDFQNGL